MESDFAKYEHETTSGPLVVLDSKLAKLCRSKYYNYDFSKVTGRLSRWGLTESDIDDPQFCEVGPEILDIEVTTKCRGPNGKLCPFCYKANTPSGQNMSFDTFKTILDKMPHVLTQIAYGADAQAASNPDLFKMMAHARSKGIIPNITVADVSDETARKLADVCGAVAVSAYEADKNLCYNSVKKLTDLGMKQINIHAMLSRQSLSFVHEVVDDVKKDKRLERLNCVVFLGVKPRGRAASNFHPVSSQEFGALVDHCVSTGINYGMDSCSCQRFLKWAETHGTHELLQLAEPCESLLFSLYISVDGVAWPCSFSEKEERGISVLDHDFSEVWNGDAAREWRKRLLANNRECPVYKCLKI